MSKSPTLNNIDKNFSKLKRKLGLKSNNNDESSKCFVLIVILYLFVTLLLVLYYKPKHICHEKKPYEEDCDYKISYSKLLLFYLLLQIPLLIYIMFSKSSSR